MRPWSIALVSDFFHPKIGGVESHIYLLAQALMARGHRVVVVTHAHPPFRYGVRYLTLGLKVYYLPLRLIPPSELHATLPNLFLAFPLLRQVFIREQVQIVHAHAALSNLGLEAILHARTMRIKAVFTDHSLLGLGGFGEVWGNKMLRACLSDVDGVLCVSKACRDNTSVRAHLDPSTIHVIPSAVVASEFTPIPQPTRGQAITIVCMSRLVYRKGIDLLIGAIPSICARYPRVRFLIGGDGPKMVELEQMRQRHQALLADRVELLGPVRHEMVRHVLRQGQIFLNTALTEAFGIGILEAACCGLYVVSTRVGGVPEVLPDDLIELAEPNVHDVIRAISAAVDHMEAGRHSPDAAHQRVKALYTWDDITTRVEAVYAQALARPMPDYLARFEKYNACGPVFGKIMCLVIAVDWLFLMLLEWVWPARHVDLVPPLKRERLEEVIKNKKV